jgi:hypothetical protein
MKDGCSVHSPIRSVSEAFGDFAGEENWKRGSNVVYNCREKSSGPIDKKKNVRPSNTVCDSGEQEARYQEDERQH